MSEIKKQIPLRLSNNLYEKLTEWAAEDFRSLNGQIEYLLHLCVIKKYYSGSSKKDNENNV